jgi:hypothetical protein
MTGTQAPFPLRGRPGRTSGDRQPAPPDDIDQESRVDAPLSGLLEADRHA